ncbi:MAG: ATP phosphoribosyltransferase regulatory subunit [Rhodobacteraceae bacterium]|nr:ATP phosphoribosyltransferase regulatory subunit [Paracoccaceae bacterium]
MAEGDGQVLSAPESAAAGRALGEALLARFAALGAVPVEAPILLPAATLLDLYGEDIRARAYVTSDPGLGEMMLRPDFTVPVVEAHMREGAEPARYTYLGPVFRRQEPGSTRPREYLQVGYELFERDDPAAADAEVFALFSELLAPRGLRAATGDAGLLAAAVAGLETSPARKAALARHIWRPARFRRLLDRFGGRTPLPEVRASLLARLEQAGPEALITGAGPEIGLRAAQEVAARLQALAEDAAQPPIPAAQVAALEALMEVRGPAPEALSAIRRLEGALPPLSAAAGRIEARLDALARCGIAPEALPFEATHGRTTQEYFDGFVFGFTAPGHPDWPPVATGGRYDALTRALGAGGGIPAIGGVIRPGLLAALERGGAQ